MNRRKTAQTLLGNVESNLVAIREQQIVYEKTVDSLQKETTQQRQRATSLEGKINHLADRINGKLGTEIPIGTQRLSEHVASIKADVSSLINREDDTHARLVTLEDHNTQALKAFAAIGERLVTVEDAPVAGGAGSQELSEVRYYTTIEGSYERRIEELNRLKVVERAVNNFSGDVAAVNTALNETIDTAEAAQDDASRALDGVENHGYLFTVADERLRRLEDEPGTLRNRVNANQERLVALEDFQRNPITRTDELRSRIETLENEPATVTHVVAVDPATSIDGRFDKLETIQNVDKANTDIQIETLNQLVEQLETVNLETSARIAGIDERQGTLRDGTAVQLSKLHTDKVSHETHNRDHNAITARLEDLDTVRLHTLETQNLKTRERLTDVETENNILRDTIESHKEEADETADYALHTRKQLTKDHNRIINIEQSNIQNQFTETNTVNQEQDERLTQIETAADHAFATAIKDYDTLTDRISYTQQQTADLQNVTKINSEIDADQDAHITALEHLLRAQQHRIDKLEDRLSTPDAGPGDPLPPVPHPTHNPYPGNLTAWQHKTDNHQIYLKNLNKATIHNAIHALEKLQP